MSLVADAASMIAEMGQTMMLARDSEGTTITLRGKRAGSGSIDPTGIGTAAQENFKVRIATGELTASAWPDKFPKRHDMLTVGSRVYHVNAAPAARDGDAVAMYELDVTG